MLRKLQADEAQTTDVPLTRDEIESIVLALRHYAAYLKSQGRDDTRFKRIAYSLEVPRTVFEWRCDAAKFRGLTDSLDVPGVKWE